MRLFERFIPGERFDVFLADLEDDGIELQLDRADSHYAF